MEGKWIIFRVNAGHQDDYVIELANEVRKITGSLKGTGVVSFAQKNSPSFMGSHLWIVQWPVRDLGRWMNERVWSALGSVHGMIQQSILRKVNHSFIPKIQPEPI